MSNESNATWPLVLKDTQRKLDLLSIPDYLTRDVLLEQHDFVTRFEEICKGQKNRHATRLDYAFIDTYDNIAELAEGVAKSAPSLQDPSRTRDLGSMIWKIALATIENGSKHGASAAMLVKSLIELNKTVPQLGADIERFPDEKEVQQPLQEVYRTFFDSYAELLNILSDNTYKHNYDFSQDERIKSIIAATSAKMHYARATFDDQISQASAREQRERQVSARSTRGKGKASSQQEQGETYDVRYLVKRELGRGSFGVVEEVEEQSTGYCYARKRILFDRVGSREEGTLKVEEEVRIMQNLRHPNIVTLATFSKDSDGYSIMINPVADCHLRQYFDTCTENNYHERFTRIIRPWFDCLLDALAFTHRNDIKHRDIKPTNILISKNVVYLCDFGLAKDFSGQISSSSRGSAPEGTLEYRAPELKPNKPRGRAADVFSLGCVFSEMLTVSQGRSAEDFRKNVRREKPFRDCLPDVCNWVEKFQRKKEIYLLCVIINHMLRENPNDRVEAQKALELLQYSQKKLSNKERSDLG